jgi:hypothetical protein
VECFHSFCNGCVGVETVDLEEVDIGCVQTSEGGLDGVEDCLPGETCLQISISLALVKLEKELPYRFDSHSPC